MAMSIDDKLGCDIFHIDSTPHIIIDEDFTDQKEIDRVIMACPAQLYTMFNGKLQFNYEGCLECGTCRVVSGGKVIKSWDHPIGEKGVVFRQG